MNSSSFSQFLRLMRLCSTLSLLFLLVFWHCTAIAQNDQSIVKNLTSEAIQLYNESKWQAAYEKALPLAIKGEPQAQVLIGNLYAQGRMGSVDFSSARRWWEPAAMSGNAQAQRNYGITYLNGDGTKENPQLAREWLAEAAYGGDQDAMIGLGGLLLGKQDPIRQDAAEGYMWLRIASVHRDFDARVSLGKALRLSNIDTNSERFLQLQLDARQLTLPYAKHIGAYPLGGSDRNDGLAYLITRRMISIGAFQGNKDNVSTKTGLKSNVTLRDLGLRIGKGPSEEIPEDTMVWVFYRKGFRLDGPEAVPVPSATLWDIVRPGDAVEVSDGINSHLTFAYMVDRIANRIDFIDSWPNEIMLLPGRNGRNIKAQLKPYGKSRLLVSITKEEFLNVGRGILTFDEPELVMTLFTRSPDLLKDVRVKLAVGSILVQHENANIACQGTGHLWELLFPEHSELSRLDRDSAADRFAFGLERCRQAGLERIAYTDLLTRKTKELSVHELANISDQKLLPTLASLDTESLIRFTYSMTIRGDARNAMKMINAGLTRVPDNEKLLMARALVHVDKYSYDEALADLDAAIASLEVKLNSKDKLVRDSDDNIVHSAWAKLSFRRILRQGYLYRGWVYINKDRPSEAIKDALVLLDHNENNPYALKLAIEGYQAIGDTENVKKLTNRLATIKADLFLDRIFGVIKPDPS